MKKWIWRIIKIIGGLVAAFVLIIVLFWIRAGFVESETREEAAPPTGRFVTAGDVDLYIQEMGPADGQDILFIHGTAAWSEFWRETMTQLAAAGFHCVAIDIPPFGFSQRPVSSSFGNKAQASRIVALMDALEISSATLFGHSFGGGATMEAALMNPARIDRLILLDVGGLNLGISPEGEIDSTSGLSWFMNTPLIRNPVLAATASNPLLTKTITATMVFDPDVVTPELKSIVRMPLALEGATNSFGNWLAYVMTVEEFSLTSDPENYRALTMPALVVWGDSDSIIPLQEGEYLASLLPNAELVVMKDVNHIPYLENNKKLMEIVFEFLSD
jgi:pimeloyl-ACP methyl ester carboxylesterase